MTLNTDAHRISFVGIVLEIGINFGYFKLRC